MYDWGGEFNTFIVPYNPFGEPTVVRKADARPRAVHQGVGRCQRLRRTRIEPNGELGLFTQADPAVERQQRQPARPAGPAAKAKIDTIGGPEDDRNTALPL
jgi:hypothetical protein